jgi:TM2 domain-containing membrane protein YozV
LPAASSSTPGGDLPQVRRPPARLAGSPEEPALREAADKKLAAGLCAILLGPLGVHKFILGLTTPGISMLCITVLRCGIAWPVMHIIGMIEGIIYLTKSDEEFYQTYIVEQKGWF